jgi:hypothetical protein
LNTRQQDAEDFERKKAERVSGVPDVNYDLISVLYHTLQDCETVAKYAVDADNAGDEELAQFFNELQLEDRMRAERAQRLLGSRLQKRH